MYLVKNNDFVTLSKHSTFTKACEAANAEREKSKRTEHFHVERVEWVYSTKSLKDLEEAE